MGGTGHVCICIYEKKEISTDAIYVLVMDAIYFIKSFIYIYYFSFSTIKLPLFALYVYLL